MDLIIKDMTIDDFGTLDYDDNNHLIGTGRVDEAEEFTPVQHGKWVELRPFKNIYACSLCGRWGEYHWNYCPHCGAKIDEVEETSNATQYIECVINLYKETKLRFVLDEYIEDEELIEKILKALDEAEK